MKKEKKWGSHFGGEVEALQNEGLGWSQRLPAKAPELLIYRLLHLKTATTATSTAACNI
jgi:hypothetical protein